MTTPEIVIFTMVYSSDIAQSSVPSDTNFIEKLDFILSKHIEQMTPGEYSALCGAIAGTPIGGAIFNTFLHESVAHAQSLLQDNSFSLDELPAVTAAFSRVINTEGGIDETKAAGLKAAMDQAVLENARSLKVNEAVNLI
jgi:hypothetical protein